MSGRMHEPFDFWEVCTQDTLGCFCPYPWEPHWVDSLDGCPYYRLNFPDLWPKFRAPPLSPDDEAYRETLGRLRDMADRMYLSLGIPRELLDG